MVRGRFVRKESGPDLPEHPGVCYQGETWTFWVFPGEGTQDIRVVQEGLVRNRAGDEYEYRLFESGRVRYARRLGERWRGLGRTYTDWDQVVPRYVWNGVRGVYAQGEPKREERGVGRG